MNEEEDENSKSRESKTEDEGDEKEEDKRGFDRHLGIAKLPVHERTTANSSLVKNFPSPLHHILLPITPL